MPWAYGGVLFTVGYALREYGTYNYLYKENDMAPLIVFILSQVFIYIAPPLLELANYHVLGRMFYYAPYFAPIPAGKVLGIFGGLMAIVEILNSLGVSLAANPSSKPTIQSLGSYLSIAAISIQLFLIISFVCIAGIFHVRCVKARLPVKAIRTLLFTLYASTALIFGRCVYRMAEHAGPTKKDIEDIESLRALSPLFRYEVFFYIFESALMLLNSVLWNVWNPGRFLPRDYHVYLAQDGTELQGEKDVDDRPRLAKVAHVLTMGLMFRRKRPNYATQELAEYRVSDDRDTSALH